MFQLVEAVHIVADDEGMLDLANNSSKVVASLARAEWYILMACKEGFDVGYHDGDFEAY